METEALWTGIELVEQSRGCGTARARFDRAETPAAIAVVTTLSQVLDSDPIEMTPLHSAVDPDALNALVAGHGGNSRELYVSFTHEGHTVRVYGHGAVEVARRDPRSVAGGDSAAGRAEERPLTSRAQLGAELRALIHRASENGIDVQGGFEYCGGPEGPDWDIVVTEVETDGHATDHE